MKLWIDDLRLPPEGWVWAKTSEEAINILNSGAKIEEMSLDHDLGGDDTVMNFFAVLEEKVYEGSLKFDFCWTVHSMNPVGRASIIRAFKRLERYSDARTN